MAYRDDRTEVGKLLDEVAKIIASRPPSAAPSEGTEPEIPGMVELEVSGDAMTVFAHFYPPVGAGAPLALEAVYEALSKLAVVHGILHPVIRPTVLELNTDRRVREGVVVARGTPPLNSVPEHWEVSADLVERKSQWESGALTLDPKERSPFVMVKAGDLLAFGVPATAGNGGRDVFGKEIRNHNPAPPPFLPGDNVVVGSVCTAGCDGVFKTSAEGFQVDKVLLVDGVDYGTGHIDFKGDVILRGEVAPGFRIRAEGSVFSSQIIDASDVTTGGDVVTTKGIIGRNGAAVAAGGSIKAKFVENIILRAEGTIEVQGSALNSVFETLDKVVLGERALLVGGKITAQNGVDAFQIGTERGASTEICCGMDYRALEMVVQSRDQVIRLVGKLKEIDHQRKLHPAMKAVLDQAFLTVRDEISRLNEVSKSWVAQIDKREEAQVVVRGTIFPGSSVEICHQTTVVSRPLSGVRFFLDKTRGVVAWEPL